VRRSSRGSSAARRRACVWAQLRGRRSGADVDVPLRCRQPQRVGARSKSRGQGARSCGSRRPSLPRPTRSETTFIEVRVHRRETPRCGHCQAMPARSPSRSQPGAGHKPIPWFCSRGLAACAKRVSAVTSAALARRDRHRRVTWRRARLAPREELCLNRPREQPANLASRRGRMRDGRRVCCGAAWTARRLRGKRRRCHGPLKLSRIFVGDPRFGVPSYAVRDGLAYHRGLDPCSARARARWPPCDVVHPTTK